MIVSVRSEGDFTQPGPIEEEYQTILEEVAEAIGDKKPDGEWTPESLLEKADLSLYKLVRIDSKELLKHPDIKELLQEMADERNTG